MFPMEQNIRLHKDDDSPEDYASQYNWLVGRLLYITVTQLVICFSVNQLSQFLRKPRKTLGYHCSIPTVFKGYIRVRLILVCKYGS